MIATIAHIAYVARDMQATLRFYCGQLGFEHAFTLPGDDGRPKAECVKIAEGQLLELFLCQA